MISFTEQISLRRYQPPTIDHGMATGPVSFQERSIWAAVQPVSLRELQTLLEGKREVENITIWTETPLFVDNTQNTADRVVYQDNLYEIWEVRHYKSPAPIPHYRATASLLVEESP